MGEKDISEKILFDYNDVFADIINVCVFDGRENIKPEDLENALVHSQYKAEDGKLHEEERDIAKFWKQKKSAIALYGIENQTKAEKIMPLRILGYDGNSYRSQLLKDSSGELYPVVTIVLYFGWESHWDEPKSLKKVLTIPKELNDYVNDYKIHVFEIAWLSDEQVEMFQSDFRIVAEFFTQMRKNSQYKPTPKQIKHVDAVLKMLSVFGQTDKLDDFMKSGDMKEGLTMNKMLDEIEERGVEKGVAKGISVLVKTLREYGNDNETIISKLIENFSLTEEEAKKYI